MTYIKTDLDPLRRPDLDKLVTNDRLTRTTSMNYIIVASMLGESIKFWTGKRWTTEYPEAARFAGPVQVLLKHAESIPFATEVVEYYGLANEHGWPVKRTTGTKL